MDLEEYRKKIEEGIIKILEDRLVQQKMDITRAGELAKYILDTLRPHMTLQQIYDVSRQFNDHFPELGPVAAEIQHDYDEQIKIAVTDQVATLIKQGKLTEATSLLKKANHQEIKLKT